MNVSDLVRAPFPDYAQNVLRIVSKDAKLIPFTLNTAQQYVHDKIEEQLAETGRVRAIVLKARQEGVSTYVAGRFFRRTQTRPFQRALVVADIEERAGALFNIYDRFDTNLDPGMRPMKRSSKQSRLLIYGNPDKNQRQDTPGLDSQISVRSARDPNAGRGSTIHMAHMSEMAFWEKGEDTFISLMSAIPDDGSEVIIESTAKAAGDLFHQTWQEAEAGENGFIAIFLPWWIMHDYQRPVSSEDERVIRDTMDAFELETFHQGVEWEGETYKLTLEQLQWRRETWRNKCKSDWTRFAQEYPSSAAEAFVVSGAQFFDPVAVKEYIETAIKPRRGNIREAIAGDLAIQVDVTEDINGYLRVWDEPSAEGHYVIGCDTATGEMIGSTRGSFHSEQSERGGRDFSCAVVWDVHNFRMVAVLHGRMAPEVFADQVALLGNYYKCLGRSPAMICVERNHSSGMTVIARLLDIIGYPNIYLRREFNQRSNKVTRQFGWVTSHETRPMMLDELAAMVREGSIGIPDADTLREMSTFVRRDDGSPSAQDGLHDDRVMSLAITIQSAKVHGCSSGVLPPTLTFEPLQGADNDY